MELRTKYIIVVCKHLHHEQHSVGVCIGLEDAFHLEGSVFPLQETLAAFPNQVSVNQLCLTLLKALEICTFQEGPLSHAVHNVLTNTTVQYLTE